MTTRFHLPFVSAIACLLIVSSVWAATKAEYRAASIRGLRGTPIFERTKVALKPAPEGSTEGNAPAAGIGNITLLPQLLLAGRQSNDAELLGMARDIVLACNKVALDGQDTRELTRLKTIGFGLYELALAVPELNELKLLPQRDAQRADEMLKKAADFSLKHEPEPGNANIAQRRALGVAAVCVLFSGDPRMAKWKAWAEKPYLQMLHYPDREKLPGARPQVLQKQGERWTYVDDTRPFVKIQAVDIVEDSSGYQASTILSWIGIARLFGREAEIKIPAVEALIERMYQQVLPVGILPAYGDAGWNGPSSPLWIGIFEWAGAAFHQPKYRAAADAVFRYNVDRGLPLGDLSEAIRYTDETLNPEPAPRGSILLERVSGRGQRIPDKVVLRGSDAGGSIAQPYVMVQATENLTHAQADPGSISAFCAGGSVLLHTLGYDATAAPLHQSFIVSAADEPFLNFFGDPKGTQIAKVMPDGQRLTAKIISNHREVRSAAVCDDGKIAYGKVACDYLPGGHAKPDLNGHAFLHSRELALDKASGLLCVLDTIQSKDNVTAAFGPVWHVQHVLAQNAQGFLCQTDYQAKFDGRVDASKPRPVWIAMAGPAGTEPHSLFWRFIARNGHLEVPQQNHLSAQWRGTVAAGQKLSFLTVLVPLPAGTTSPPSDLKLSAEEGRAWVKFGVFSYAFSSTK